MKGDILQFQKLYAKDVQSGHSISVSNRVPMSQLFSNFISSMEDVRLIHVAFSSNP
jgi:hypothetical protein